MKQKVLFALIALMSFMTSWADDVVTVGGYKVTIDTKLVAIPVGPATATAPSVTKVTKGTETTNLLSSVADKVYKIEAGALQEATLNEAGNYFLQVTLTDKASLLVPFRAGLTGEDYFDTEYIWNKETFEASVQDGILHRYYAEDELNMGADDKDQQGKPSWSVIAQNVNWRAKMFPQINYRVKGLDNEKYAVYATYSATEGEETVTKGTYTENEYGYPALYGNGNFWMLSIPQLYAGKMPYASGQDNVDGLNLGEGYVLNYTQYTEVDPQTGEELPSWWDTASKEGEKLDFDDESTTIQSALNVNFDWDNVQLFLVPQDDPYKLTVSLNEYYALLDEGVDGTVAPEFTVSFGEEELDADDYDFKWYNAEGNEVTLDGETNTYPFDEAGTYTLVVTYEAEGDYAPTYTAVAQYVVVPYTYTYNDWTMTPVKATYIGVAFDPTITVDATDSKGEPVEIDANYADDVIVKYYTDAELTKEVDEMKHAGTYYVQVYVPGEAEEEAEQQGDDNQQGDNQQGDNQQGDNQQGDNQQGDNQQGDNQQGDNVEPAPAADEDPLAGYVALGEAKTFTINKNTLQVVLQQIYMPYGSALADLMPDYALQKTSLDMTPEEDIAVENLGNIIKGSGWAQGEEETLDPDQVRNYTTSSKPKAYVGRTYDEEGNVVEEGYEDYIVTTNTSSANIVAIKGTLTVDIDADDLTKVYGFEDPEYTFTAKNQAGEDVEGVEITRADKGTVEGEAVGKHDLTVTFDATHYDLILTVNGEEGDAQLEITPFNISLDNNTENGYGADVENYTEKFIIVKADSIYNGYAQYLDPVIKFNHAELGLVTLSNFVDYPVVGKGETYTTNDYTYTKKALSSGGNYGGSYRWVKRDATTAEVLDGATIRVDAVEGEGKNFTGSKTQAWAIQPAPLAVKVKDYTGENAKAYLSEATFEMETVGESDVVGYDQATSEPEHDKAALLAGLAAAIAEANGFEGYTKGDAASETPYTIKVKAEAQTAVAVIMSMKNYALDFTNSDGSLEIKKIMLALKATDQTIDYPAPADEKYTSPVADTEVKESTVTIVEGVLPEGYELGDLVTLEQKTTKVGANDGGIELKKNENVDASIEFTVADGKLTINPLAEIRLSYENMAQALEDHKGQTVDVYLSNRKIKEDQWYAMVLPFEFSVPQFSNKLYYGVVDLLDTENASDDVRFKLTVGTVPANTPFMFKLAKDPAKADQAEAMTADQLATICFEDVTIGDGEFAYNDAAKAPFSVDAANHKFVGLYPTVATSGANKFGKVGMEANEWFISTADGGFYSGAGNPNQKMLQTDAFISFPTAEAGAKARFFIEDADGTVTAIEGIDAEVPAEGNADAAREGWYTVNGVKLNAQPTQKGLYIFNGKKVYVK